MNVVVRHCDVVSGDHQQVDSTGGHALADRPRLTFGDRSELVGWVQFPPATLYLAWLAVNAAYFLYAYVASQRYELDVTSLGLVLLVAGAHLVRAVLLRRDPLSPDVFFTVFFVAFHFAGHALTQVGLTVYDEHRFVPFPDYLNLALLYSCTFYTIFLIGYELRNARGRILPQFGVERISPLAAQTAQMIFFGAVAVMLIDVARSGGQVLSVQYQNAMYTEGAKLYRGWAAGSTVALMAIFIYVAASIHARSRIFQSRLFLIVVGIFLIFVFLSGKRGAFLSAAIPGIFVFHHFVKPIRLRWIVIPVALFLLVSPALRFMRAGGGSFDLGRLVEGVQHTETPFIDSLAEAGGTYRVVNAAMYYIEQDGFFWGRTYLGAAGRILPFMGGFLQERFGATTPSLWITMRHQGGGAGMGGSIAMEAYINFGLWGLLVALIMGWLYRALYENALLRPTFLRTFLLCAATLLLIRAVRAEVAMLVRPLVWGSVVVIAVNHITRQWSKVRG